MPFSAYMSTFDKDFANIEELVIHINLSKHTSNMAEKLLEKWISGQFSYDMMEEEINRIFS
jgi:hypothetical protein